MDRNSFDKTLENLINYRKEVEGNFVYDIFNWDTKYYGYNYLSKIQIVRKGSSDMLDISFQSDDPGIATNTLIFLNEELAKRYERLLLSASNDVVKHFEEQLALAKIQLELSEDELVKFNIENKIINYEEQTKHLAALNNSIETRYDEVVMQNRSSKALVDELEKQMETRSKLILENELFIKQLANISDLNGKIAEIEIFSSDLSNNETLKKYKSDLIDSEKRIRQISNNMEQYKFSKEGFAIPEMVTQWLDALLMYEKSKAEIAVMSKRRDEITAMYEIYSPVGPNLGKQTRNVRVEEQAYLTILHHLGLAKLKQKNILVDAGTIQVVTPPTIPLLVVPRKREIYVIAAFFGAIFFIIGSYLLLEFIDRTFRDGSRTERLLGGKVIAAFPSNKQFKHRRFNEEVKQIATTYLASFLNGYYKPGFPLVINVLSIEDNEGKSFISSLLQNYWTDKGFKVKYVSHQDILVPESKTLMQALYLSDLLNDSNSFDGYDVVIAEYASLSRSVVPENLLNEALVSVLVVNAERTCRMKDQILYDRLAQSIPKEKLVICLNYVMRDVVEQYTGMLPPITVLRKFMNKILNMGFTSKT
ncbi:hypothetical protein MASR1M31_20600 [Porphyromonadaceae bacterium]